jgi:hypothetical protein
MRLVVFVAIVVSTRGTLTCRLVKALDNGAAFIVPTRHIAAEDTKK